MFYYQRYTDQELKVYKTKNVISEIKTSQMNKKNAKDKLLEIIIYYGYDTYLDEYDGLKEILDEIEDIELKSPSK